MIRSSVPVSRKPTALWIRYAATRASSKSLCKQDTPSTLNARSNNRRSPCLPYPFLSPARKSRFPYRTNSVSDYDDNSRPRQRPHRSFFVEKHRISPVLSQSKISATPPTLNPGQEYIHQAETKARYKPSFPDQTSFSHRTIHH